MRSIYCIIVFLLFCLSGIKAQMSKFDSNWKEQVQNIVDRYEGQPGLALGITESDQIIYKGFSGFANLDYDISIDQNTVFDIASLSKQITVYCIYLLEAEGKLNLDAPITEYVAGMPDYDEGPITIRHLIHHTSGLRSYLKIKHMVDQTWDGNYSNDDCMELLTKQQKLNFQPGERHAYSNSGYVLLAEIIAKVSGQSLTDFAKENVFDPIGMKKSFFSEDRNEVVKHRAIGYAHNGNDYERMHFFDSKVIGDGGLHTTLDDLLLWSLFFREGLDNKNQVVHNMLNKGRLLDGTELSYAGGLIHNAISGMPTLGHSGEWAGFRSIQIRFVDEKVSFTLLSNNAEINLWGILYEVIGILYPEDEEETKVTADNSQEIKHDESGTLDQQMDLYALEGNFFNPIEGYTRKLKVIDNSLHYVRSNSVSTRLVAKGDHLFSFAGADHVTLNVNPSAQKMTLNIAGSAPIQFKAYEPIEYTDSELLNFEGTYYSEELDLTYSVKVDSNTLALHKGNSRIAVFNPVMKEIFNEVHFGYLKFNREDGNITGFTVNDETVRDILFVRI
ncbi:MAG: serine hydrolase domain-containing protein [Bacteroidota bacterium]